MIKFREHRLQNRYMFGRVLRDGEWIKEGELSVCYLKGFESSEISRIGFIIRKSNGNAVLRNKLKRIFRKAFQRRMPEITMPVWMVFSFKPGPIKASLKNILDSSQIAINKIVPC